MSRRYTHIKELATEIDAMLAQGKSHREIEAHFGLEGDRPIHNLLKRRRREAKRIAAGLAPKQRGRPRKGPRTSEEDYKYEINRLKMENKLLRDFLQSGGRR